MDITAFWRDIIGIKDSWLLGELTRYSSVRSLKKNDIVIRENEPLTEIPLLMSGVVKSYCLDTEGKEKIICLVYQPGAPVTSIYSLDGDISSIGTIAVVCDASLLYIPVRVLKHLIENNREAAQVYENILSGSLKEVVERDRVLASCTVRQRYEWFVRYYPGLEKLVSKKDIASFLNMSSESLSRGIRAK
ncbi:MAG: Crp/Fnr family transcriptional regulator [Lachnospiraceae bacterium]|nr:Crp/Fnr family transcriptional regulator [Lachnospiraceae bacterium]MCD7765938.1 Crp/Fnr family transcriptional regulator [Lachnospiraceae bacterium]